MALDQAKSRTLFRDMVNANDTSVVTSTQVDYYLLAGLEALNAELGAIIEEDTINLTSGTAEYTAATDVTEVIHVLHGARPPLQKADFHVWRSRGIDWANADPDFPREYAVHGRSITLWPRPSAQAVAFSGSIALRTIDSPADTADAVWAKFSDAEGRLAVYYAAAEFCAAPWRRIMGPEAADRYLQLYERRLGPVKEAYARRVVR